MEEKFVKPDRTVLDVLLDNSEYIFATLYAFQSLIRDLGDDAEIISDALQYHISCGDFGCPEDAAKTVMWALYLDSVGQNYRKPEFDTLRNGTAAQLLLRQAYPAAAPAAQEDPDHV